MQRNAVPLGIQHLRTKSILTNRVHILLHRPTIRPHRGHRLLQPPIHIKVDHDAIRRRLEILHHHHASLLPPIRRRQLAVGTPPKFSSFISLPSTAE
jgi:hypothetical protein